MAIGICYHLQQPIVFNKGTKYETQESNFLLCLGTGTLEEAQKTCEEINRTKAPAYGDKNYQWVIDWDKIEYIFAEEQEPFID